jgi:molecular chaperone DnaJ
MTTQRCYYEILSVERTASDGELKSAFRKAAMQHHPDRNPGDPEAEKRFKECNEAYSILSDAQKRAAYDRYGHAGVGGGGGQGGGAGFGGFQDASDIFSDVFGDVFGEMFGGGGRRSGGPQRGQDLRYDLEITLEQAFTGAEVNLKVPSTQSCDTCDGSGAKPGTQPTLCQTCGGHGRVRASQGFFSIERSCPRCGGQGRIITDPCRTCHGVGQVRKERTLQVRIPAGVDDGARIRLQGEGDAGQKGGPRGDLYIFLSIRPHELFARDGLDLYCDTPVPMWMAVLGGEIEAPAMCPDGMKTGDAETCRAKVKVPEGAQSGDTVRLRGRGMPSLRGRERGDLIVGLKVETPVRLTAKQKELMRELAATMTTGDGHHPRQTGFFDKARRFWNGVVGGAEGAAG